MLHFDRTLGIVAPIRQITPRHPPRARCARRAKTMVAKIGREGRERLKERKRLRAKASRLRRRIRLAEGDQQSVEARLAALSQRSACGPERKRSVPRQADSRSADRLHGVFEASDSALSAKAQNLIPDSMAMNLRTATRQVIGEPLKFQLAWICRRGSPAVESKPANASPS